MRIQNQMIKTAHPCGHNNEMNPTENPWTSSEEMLIVLSVISSFESPTVLELGTQIGTTSVNIGRVLSKIGGRLLTLDVTNAADTMPTSQVTEVPDAQTAGSLITYEPERVQDCIDFQLFDARLPDGSGMTPILDTFTKAHGDFDVVFFDGDHSFDGLNRDASLVAPYLSFDGVRLYHDVWWDCTPPPVDGPIRYLGGGNGEFAINVINLTHVGTDAGSVQRMRERGL